MVNLDNVAEALRLAYLDHSGKTSSHTWATLPKKRKEKWLVMARRAAEVLGVDLD